MNTITALGICTSCELYKLAKTNCIRGQGPSQCDLMFVGDAPGEDEDQRNQPFIGPAGEVLDRLLFNAGVARQSVFVTNTVKCRPIDESRFRMDRSGTKHFFNKTPDTLSSYVCATKHLEGEISARKPKVIVAMGSTAIDYLMGRYELLPDGTMRMNAKQDKAAIVRRLPSIMDLIYGEYWDVKRQCYIVPMLHPSAIMISPELFVMMGELIKKASEIAKLGPGKEKTQTFCAENFDDAMALIRRALEHHVLGYDHETTGLDERFCYLINTGFSWKAGTGATIRWVDNSGKSLYTPDQRASLLLALKPIFCGEKTLITYNGPFDDSFTEAHLGYRVTAKEHDVQTIFHTLNSAATYRAQSLEKLSWLYTRMEDYKKESTPWFSKKDFLGCPIPVMSRRNCSDADATLRLFERFWPTLEKNPVINHYNTTISNLPRMSTLLHRNGAAVSLEKLKMMRDRLEEASDELGEQFRRMSGSPETMPGPKGKKPVPYNPRSPKHLKWTLFEHLKLPILLYTPKGSPKMDEYVLTELGKKHEALQPLLEYKKLQKLLGTYVLGLRGCALFGNSKQRKPDVWTVKEAQEAGYNTDGRVHPNFSVIGTITGRPSVTNPNVANQPRPTDQQRALGVVIRQAFTAPDGCSIVEYDLSQAELRALASASGDEVLLAAINSPEGVHKRTAAKLYAISVESVNKDQKDSAKTIVFAIIYGGTEYTVEEQIPEVLDAELRRRYRVQMANEGKIYMELDQLVAEFQSTKEQRLALALEWVESFRAQYPKSAAWIEGTKEFARKNGYVKSAFGRVFYFPLIFSKNFGVRAACERACVNYPLQSVVPDITFAACVRIQKEIERRGYKSLLINMVYDALFYQVPDAELEAMKVLIKTEMERPIPEMSVNMVAEGEIGHCWKEDKAEEKAPVLDEPEEIEEEDDDERTEG